MGIDSRGQRAHMPREPLRQEQVPRSSVDVRDRRVPQRVERVEAVEAGLCLPRPEGELDAAGGNAATALVAEEWGLGPYPFAPRGLVAPELPELAQQGIGQEDVAGTAVLGDLGPEAD